MSHEAHDVASVTVDMTDDRAPRALVLDGTGTTVAFPSPARLEEVDGIRMERR